MSHGTVVKPKMISCELLIIPSIVWGLTTWKLKYNFNFSDATISKMSLEYIHKIPTCKIYTH